VSAPRAEFVRQMVSWPIDMSKSSFACDNANLCRVYEFCKYSINWVADKITLSLLQYSA
jgi:hypothetical protein